MFLDASVIVALLAGEPEAGEIAAATQNAPFLATSPLAIFEALSRLTSLNNRDFDLAQQIIEHLGGMLVALRQFAPFAMG